MTCLNFALRSLIPVSSRRSSLTSRAAATALSAFLIAMPAMLPGAAAARPAPDSFADLAEKLLPSVVNISTQQTLKSDRGHEHAGPEMPQFPPGSPFEEFFRDFFEHGQPKSGRPEAQPRKATSLGSGFIIDPTGYIVTNNHVIADADEITVVLHDDTNLKAELVGRDTKTDIALLKVNTDKPLPAAVWGDSDAARVGDWVLAIGNPFGLGGSVTAGILSARQRDISSGPYDDFLQTDASINRGNSGGPMFNMDGQVIGINTAIFSPSGGSIGIGFAIPSALARSVVTELKGETDHAVHRGWLGVRIQAVTDEIAESLGLEKARGALIASVAENGPAQAAGIQAGDVVIGFDGKPVGDMRRLPRLVAETPVDKTVPVTIWRKHGETTVEVKIGKLEENEQQQASTQEQPKAGAKAESGVIKTLGLTLAAITPELKEKFSLGEDAKGVIVVDVAKDSPAAAKGVRPGDMIMEAAQEEVKSPGEINSKVDEAKKQGRKSILLLVERQGDLRFVALRLDQG
ncbi:MAG: DegQ family serine endoprotease [Alphaproteobacteria bacterium]|nr:DegQ family serine endoprotease [Alphaproteobacteria bacterium]